MSWVRSGEEQKEENGNFIGILKSSYYILEWYLFSLCTYIVRATSTWFESESLERSSSCKGSMRHMNEIEKSFRRKWHNYIYRIGRMEIGKWKLFTRMLFGFWLLLPSVVDWDGVQYHCCGFKVDLPCFWGNIYIYFYWNQLFILLLCLLHLQPIQVLFHRGARTFDSVQTADAISLLCKFKIAFCFCLFSREITRTFAYSNVYRLNVCGLGVICFTYSIFVEDVHFTQTITIPSITQH